MTRIFLIRHGQSEWNKLNLVQGQQDTMLTDLGKRQAMKLGNRLMTENIDRVYTSDLSRAYTTAKLISDIIDKPLISNEALREINFGPWEGLDIQKIREDYSYEYAIWNKEPHKLNMNGAETLKTLQYRSMNYVNDIINENKGKNIAIVSHSATLKTIILGLLEMNVSYYKNISLSNVSLTIVECRSYNNVLTLLNDVSHLKELL
ncbi:histidine phosphatase family protein [Tissierella praeacuta]|uniref:histidine phosphatase family protein n=1 Tax=Tissierella praeacuta TaxID=43131 RepID=UPI003342DBF0